MKDAKGNKTSGKVLSNESASETTIYHNVLDKIGEPNSSIEVVDPEISFKIKEGDMKLSSSSDECIDTSDELMEGEEINMHVSYIVDHKVNDNRWKRGLDCDIVDNFCENQDDPGAQEHADSVIQEAEASKARILATPGNNQILDWQKKNHRYSRGMAVQHSSAVDENYLVIGGCVEQSLHEKIIKGECGLH